MRSPISALLFPLAEPDKPLPLPRAPRVSGFSPVVGQLHLVVEDGGVVGGHADLDDLV